MTFVKSNEFCPEITSWLDVHYETIHSNIHKKPSLLA